MTEKFSSYSADMKKPEHEKLSPAEELHHISEQLEEIIQLLRSGAESSTKETSADLPPNDSEVMTVKEAAAMLRISLPKMYEFARSGRVHSLEVGRRVLISRSSLLSLLREGE